MHVPSASNLTASRTLGALASLALATIAGASGETVTVDVALDDYMDFGGAQAVADLPGPDGRITIREAVTAANNTPGAQTIAFAIPASEWSFWFTDRAIIRIEMMLYLSDNDTTIDFSTQTAFTGDTNPSGNEVGLHYAGVPASIPCIWLAGNNCTVKGLDVAFGNNFSNTIWITGNSNRVLGSTTNGLTIRGDYGGGDFNTIGGTAIGEGNTFSEGAGIYSGASSNVVIGNNFRWGLRITGDTLYGTCDNNRIGGPTAAERNVLAGHGYYAEEGVPSGTQLEVQYANNTIIENNYVGTTPDGSAKFAGNSGSGGIAIYTAAVNTIVRNNLVSGIEMTGINHVAGQRFGIAIGVGSTATGTVLTGNRLGVAANGVTPILNVRGFVAYSDPNGVPNNTVFGGPAAGQGNLVANSESVGVHVLSGATGVRITGNSIHSNGGLGIDLASAVPLGVTSNDSGDSDSGANGLQNFPVLTFASGSAASTAVQGSLNSLANRSFTIEFFASPTCDASGNGEGRTYLGATTVTTDGAGNAAIAATIAAGAPAGSMITATATDNAGGNTSEFSACVSLAVGSVPGDVNGDGQVNVTDLLAVIGAWGACPPQPTACPADVTGDGAVNVTDLLLVIGHWG